MRQSVRTIGVYPEMRTRVGERNRQIRFAEEHGIERDAAFILIAQTKGQRQPDTIATIANRATEKVGAVAPIKSAVDHFEAHLGISLASAGKLRLDSLRRQPHRDTQLVPAFGCESARFRVG